MQEKEKVMQEKDELEFGGWEELAEYAREQLAQHRKSEEGHLRRIRTLCKSLRYFEEQIKNKVPWIKDPGGLLG